MNGIVTSLAATQGAAVLSTTAGGSALAGLGVWLLAGGRRTNRPAIVAFAAVLGAMWGAGHWAVILRFAGETPTLARDPVLQQTLSFYLFDLPLWSSVVDLCLLIATLALLSAVASRRVTFGPPRLALRHHAGGEHTTAAIRCAGALALAWAAHDVVARHELMLAELGALEYPAWTDGWTDAWTDIHARLPALAASAGLSALVGVALLTPPLRRRLLGALGHLLPGQGAPWVGLVTLAGLVLIVRVVAPSALQGLPERYTVGPDIVGASIIEVPYTAYPVEYERWSLPPGPADERVLPVSELFSQVVEEAAARAPR